MIDIIDRSLEIKKREKRGEREWKREEEREKERVLYLVKVLSTNLASWKEAVYFDVSYLFSQSI